MLKSARIPLGSPFDSALYQGLAHDYASHSKMLDTLVGYITMRAKGPCRMVLGERSASKLSDFPLAQHFGLLVVAGCIMDIVANLFVLPPA